MRIKTLVGGMSIVSFIGFADATYLTVLHYLHKSPFCNLVPTCERVLSSGYATVGPIPVALLGALYYASILIATIFVLCKWKGNNLADTYLLYIPGIGFMMSLYLVGLQLFVIKAICLYCMVSALTSTILFIQSFFLAKKEEM